MRRILGSLIVTAALAAAAPSGASAQSIVDLSKPQPGKSRFVLNPDLTPADLGAAEAAKPTPAAALSRVPACGESCKMEPPVQARAADSRAPDEARSGNRGRVIVAVGAGGSGPQKVRPAKDRTIFVNAHTRKDGTQVGAHTRSAPSFRFRFRRR
jgi:hypothetical protein